MQARRSPQMLTYLLTHMDRNVCPRCPVCSQVIREIAIMRKLDHENVMDLKVQSE